MAFSRRSLYIGVVVVAGLIGALYFSGSLALKSGASTEPVVVRWLLAHEPAELYARATDEFAKILTQESEGRLALEIVTPEDLGLSADDIPYEDVRTYLSEGQADLSSVYLAALANEHRPLRAVSLPYLFADYESAAQALDGAAGNAVMEGMESKGLYGLAFTLSGGFRILASRTEGVGLENVSGMTVTFSSDPVSTAALRALGASHMAEGADAVETTYTRFAGLKEAPDVRTILETGHSLFMTAIVADAAFYEALSPEDKMALQKAARAAALVEREDSILLGKKVRADLESKGVVIVSPSAEERQALVEKTASVWEEFKMQVGEGTLQALIEGQR